MRVKELLLRGNRNSIPTPILTCCTQGADPSIFTGQTGMSSRARCRTLVTGGAPVPLHHLKISDIAAAISAHLVRYEEFANCGHGVVRDAPDDAMALLREFIAG